jgi:threonine aldolase
VVRDGARIADDGVALKADALEYGRVVDSVAKRITAEIESVENVLSAAKQIVDDEKARVKREAEAAAAAVTARNASVANKAA